MRTPNAIFLLGVLSLSHSVAGQPPPTSTAPQGQLVALSERAQDFFYGRGVAKDFVTALMWANAAIEMAPAGGKEEYERLRDGITIAGKVSPEQAAEARKLALDWVAAQPRSAAPVESAAPATEVPNVQPETKVVGVPAPMRIPSGSKIFIEQSDFGMALSAALLKKKVPVIGTTDRGKADFFVQSVSESKKEGTAGYVAKLLLFGAWAGSGKSFDATVTITNVDGAIVFAHNSKKENFQSAAENVAKELKKHVEGR